MKSKPILIAVCVITVGLLGFVPVWVLEIVALKSGRAVFVNIIQNGDRFTISYLHSVELSRVKDTFIVDDDYKILLYETLFQSVNAGLPHMLEGKETLWRNNEGFHISNINRLMTSIDMWVHEDFDNTLEIGDTVLRLPSLSGNTLLRIHICRISLWKYIRFRHQKFI